MPEDRPRADIAAEIVGLLRQDGVRTWPASEWEDCDAHVLGSSLVVGDLVTSTHPEGTVQVRVRRHLRVWRAVGLAAVVLGIAAIGLSSVLPSSGAMASEWEALELLVAGSVGIYVLGAAGRGWWRTGPGLRRRIRGAAV